MKLSRVRSSLTGMNDLTELRRNWGWILAFGCISILVGMFAVVYSMVFTLVSVLFLGSMLVAAGLIEGVYAVRHRERGHLVWHLLEALLGIAIGFLLWQSPARGAIVLTMLLAIYFVGAEQGATSLIPGMYVHELVHDGRHLLGFPCH